MSDDYFQVSLQSVAFNTYFKKTKEGKEEKTRVLEELLRDYVLNDPDRFEFVPLD